jgi:hypothetical protein
MSDDLQIGALHSDDALLDALGARVPGASLGVAAGVTPAPSGDLMARLLAAYAEEIDTRPGPLTELLSTPVPVGARSERPLAAVAPDAVAAEVSEPPVTVLAAARRRRLAMSRTAAIVTTGAMVLGLGGVAAAVSGKVGGFDNLRRAVSSVTGSAPSSHNAAERATNLLQGARDALNDGDLQTAQDRLAQVQRLLPLISDPDLARTLRAELDALHRRWAAVAPALTSVVSHGAGKPTPNGASSRPTGATGPAGVYGSTTTPQSPQAIVPGPVLQDPTENLSPVDNSPVGPAKDDLKDKANQKLGHSLPGPAGPAKDDLKDKAKQKLGHTLPDPGGPALPEPSPRPTPGASSLPAPVLRGPTGSGLSRELPAWTLLYNYGGDRLADPDPTSLAGARGTGNHH